METTARDSEDDGDGMCDNCECSEFMSDPVVMSAAGCCCCVGIILMCILIPLSFNYVEIYKYALLKDSLQVSYSSLSLPSLLQSPTSTYRMNLCIPRESTNPAVIRPA